jgi:hypothetical protein
MRTRALLELPRMCADEISGHKATSLTARYNMPDDADLKDAAAKTNFLKARKSGKLERVKHGNARQDTRNSSSVSYVVMRMWRNWQTRWI